MIYMAQDDETKTNQNYPKWEVSHFRASCVQQSGHTVEHYLMCKEGD